MRCSLRLSIPIFRDKDEHRPIRIKMCSGLFLSQSHPSLDSNKYRFRITLKMRGYTIYDIAGIERGIRRKKKVAEILSVMGWSSVLTTVPGSRGSDGIFHGKWAVIFVAGQVAQKK